MDLDRTVAAATILAYVSAVVLALPASEYPRMLGGAVALLAALFAIARVLGDRATPGMSAMFVSIAAAAVLVVPGFPAMGGRHRAAVPVGFLGSQAAALFWIALRWRAGAQAHARTPLVGALGWGVSGALALSAVATIPIGIALLADRTKAAELLLVYPAYFAGALSAAALYWLLQGAAHRPVGRYLIGVLGGFCMYAAAAPVVYLIDGDPIDLRRLGAVAAVCGFLVGPPVALSFAEDVPPIGAAEEATKRGAARRGSWTRSP